MSRSIPPSRRGFTLVEILIVVIILGILAAIVLPQFSNASHQAREATLKDDLRFLRSQIAVYAAQHSDLPPGLHPNGSTAASEAFAEQVTKYTDVQGTVVDATYTGEKFGPYLSRVPVNPINGSSTVHVVATAQEMIPSTTSDAGWLYHPLTRELKPNLNGVDLDGVPYWSY